MRATGLWLTIIFSSLASIASCTHNTQKPSHARSAALTSAQDPFIFFDPISANNHRPIPIHYFIPTARQEPPKIVFVMHGRKRNADKYRDTWIQHAEDNNFIILAPEFSDEIFPKSESYHLGNMRSWSGKQKPIEEWAFSSIDRIFLQILADNPNLTQTQFYLYGHSAGAQFVHRFMTFKGSENVAMAITANAGWYTVPDNTIDFPYGLKGIPYDEQRLSSLLASQMIILLGTRDNDPNGRWLKSTRDANQQGLHRLARGHHYFTQAQQQAKKRNTPFSWKIIEVKGATHSNKKMAPTAAQLILEDKGYNKFQK
jgi:hypothetical protein